MDNVVKIHPVLGELRWDNQLSWWETELEFLPGYSIYFSLDDEKNQPDEVFSAGVKYLEWARTAELACREQIAFDLLETYNEIWANADPDDGGPGVKTKEAFLTGIQLSSITRHSDGSGVWYYEDGEEELFGGHSIEIWVSENGVFSGAHLAG
ncbi:MAG: DUF2262 domain-containing protein [Planctomycetaceae bacterium]|nr:DUF2262 domain-containing protein [Planctomycetaceae bacterium]